MLAKRIIPTLLVRGRTLVKGERFDSWRSIGHAAQAARVHAARGVDELMILDISATAEGRGPDLDMVRELSAGCFIPITVGGGVRSLKDIDALLRAGADKVAICTGVHEVRELVCDASTRFGRQAIVGVIDYKQMVWPCCDTPHRTVHSRMQPLRWDHPDGTYSAFAPTRLAEMLDEQGAGEIMLSNMDADGTLCGYDLDAIKWVSDAVSVPVIASGGCRDYDDMLAAFKAGADACAAGALFAFTDLTPRGAAKHLKQHGVEVRL